MPRAFRFGAPVLRPGGLTRPRLLRALSQRWERQLTLVIAGPGFGKTTLLTQAMAENRLAPRGTDVWLGLEPDDNDAARLGGDLLRALSAAGGADGASARSIADAMWTRSPSPVALVLDDVHLVSPESGGMALLAELLELLPSNGHLVLASRVPPALPFARLASQGALVRIVEEELRFDEGELVGFSKMHDVAADVVASSAGWPAMAELAAAAERGLAAEFLWQEVLQPLGERRRLVLAALIELGGGDDELLSAALDGPADLARDLLGVPLVAADGAGRYVPHPLWSTAQRARLDPERRLAVLARGAGHHHLHGRFAETFDLLVAAEAWDEMPALFADACRGEVHVSATQLGSWIDRCPPHVLATPGGLLAAGVHARLVSPATASAPLQAAVGGFASTGNVDGELSAMSHLGHLAWWEQDLAMLAGLMPRVMELAEDGHPTAIGLASVGQALVADVRGDETAAMQHALDGASSSLAGGWRPITAWIVAALHLARGNASEALAVAQRVMPDSDAIFALTLRAVILQAKWYLGLLDEALEEAVVLVEDTAAVGIAHNVAGTGGLSAAMLATVGDVERAMAALAVAETKLDVARDASQVRVAIAKALVAVAKGDEDSAARLLEDVNRRCPFGVGMSRRAWRTALPLVYLLLPQVREPIDATPWSGVFATHHALGRALVDARLGREPDLPPIRTEDVDTARGALQVRHAAELAVALAAAGRPDGALLFGALGEEGRACMREVIERGGAAARAARALLATTPSPPRDPVCIAMLGTLELRRSGHPVDEPVLRRDRVRALLGLLAVRRQVGRDEAAGMLWPGFDAESAGNNLRVNLSHLERALEPHRSKGEPPWSIRREGTKLRLVTGPAVGLDIDEFETSIDAAGKAERDGAPSIALDHLLAAIALWRGEPFADVPDAEWLDVPREHLRSRFAAAALRAGQLLAGHGDHEQSVALATHVLRVDPWSEAAHGLIVEAALARGDRLGAQRALAQCNAMLVELDAEPSDATRLLARRVRAG